MKATSISATCLHASKSCVLIGLNTTEMSWVSTRSAVSWHLSNPPNRSDRFFSSRKMGSTRLRSFSGCTLSFTAISRTAVSSRMLTAVPTRKKNNHSYGFNRQWRYNAAFFNMSVLHFYRLHGTTDLVVFLLRSALFDLSVGKLKLK